MKTIVLKKSVLSLVWIAGIFLFSNAFGQELKFKVLKSAEDWQTAKEEAKSSGKDIFLDIYATWCGPCKMMDANVYTVASVTDYFTSNYINLKVDGETEFGRVLAAKYRLTAYPSMYFINSGEELIYQVIGYRDPEALVEAGKQVRVSGKRYQELNLIYKTAALSEAEMEEYIGLLTQFGQKELLAQLAGEQIRSFTLADVLNPSNKFILIAAGGDLTSFAVNTALQNASIIDSTWGSKDFNQYLSDVFDRTMQKAVELQDSVLMERIAEELVPVYMMGNPDRIPSGKLTTRKIYYSQVGDWDNYIKAVENHYNAFEYGNPRFLYQESYYIVENQLFNPKILDKASKWLEEIIAVIPDFDNYFLIAIINTYNQKTDEARKWMKMAESVAVTEDEKNSLEELRKYLESL
jgi:thiol-disulfide isomerase/thioredoxin